MAFRRGDVVLVPFPYADLSAAKTRPAVVVNSDVYYAIRSELLLAFVSSQTAQANPTLDHVLLDWKAAGLLKPSFVRPKIVAIEPALVATVSARCQRGICGGYWISPERRNFNALEKNKQCSEPF